MASAPAPKTAKTACTPKRMTADDIARAEGIKRANAAIDRYFASLTTGGKGWVRIHTDRTNHSDPCDDGDE